MFKLFRKNYIVLWDVLWLLALAAAVVALIYSANKPPEVITKYELKTTNNVPPECYNALTLSDALLATGLNAYTPRVERYKYAEMLADYDRLKKACLDLNKGSGLNGLDTLDT